jgi:hypothetical protein
MIYSGDLSAKHDMACAVKNRPAADLQVRDSMAFSLFSPTEAVIVNAAGTLPGKRDVCDIGHRNPRFSFYPYFYGLQIGDNRIEGR